MTVRRRPALCTPRNLPRDRLLEAVRIAYEIDAANVPGGLRLDDLRGVADDLDRLALEVGKYWGKKPRKLTVDFMDSASDALRRHILAHMNAWDCGITFVPSKVDPQVRIARLTRAEAPGFEGYWSYVGTDILTIPPDEPTMNLEAFTMKTPESEFKRVVRHEAGHTLGFPHEHMRRAIIERLDRKKTIAYYKRTQGWTKQDVLDQVLTPIEEASILGTAQSDETSIMCYDAPGEITRDGEPIVGGADINAADYAFAREVYPKHAAKKKSTRASPPEPTDVAASDPRLHVLLIGVDAYAMVPLAGCVNDIDAIQDVLLRRLRVPAAAIRRLAAPRDGASHSSAVPADPPTRDNIVGALTQLAAAARPGDRVFIYYSGHGTQVPCRGADGVEFTREALLPVDHRTVAPRYVFDWELNALVARIAAVTPAVTCILDCCCSAGVSREGPRDSDAQDRFFPVTAVYTVPAGTDIPERERGRGVIAGLSGGAGSAVIVAACLGDEKARESTDGGVRHGELTRALVRALGEFADDGLRDLRWVQLWRPTVAAVAQRNATQHPWISTNEPRRVFGGPPEDGDPGYAIRPRGDEFVLDAGSLSGVTENAELAVYPALPPKLPPLGSDADLLLRLGRVHVTRAGLADAVAVANGPLAALPGGARARLVTAGDAARLRVALRPADDVVAARIDASGLLKVVRGESGDATLVRRRDGAWAITDEVFGDGESSADPSLPAITSDALDQLVPCLEHYARYTAPLRLARECRDLPRGLQVRLLECPRVEAVAADVAQDPPYRELPPGTRAQYEMSADPDAGTAFCIRVDNTADVKLYVSLLLCDDRGRVAVLSGRQDIGPRRHHVFWHPNGLGRPFVATLPDGRRVGVDRLIAVGTTDATATFDHLIVGTPFVDVLRGFRDFGAVGPRDAGPRWTATITAVRMTLTRPHVLGTSTGRPAVATPPAAPAVVATPPAPVAVARPPAAPVATGSASAARGDGVDVDVTDRSPADKRKRTRAWSRITGIVLHQTGVHGFPARAWPRVTAHVGVDTDGKVWWIHPLQAHLWASHGFNATTVAIEVAGNYRREEGRLHSFWAKGGGPDALTPAAVEGIRRAIQFIIAEVERHGGRIAYVHAHRQASKTRPACPGEAIWRAGGVWAQETLGLSDGGDGYTIGDGLPIPRAWDERRGQAGDRGDVALDDGAPASAQDHEFEVDAEYPDPAEVEEVVRLGRGVVVRREPAQWHVRRVTWERPLRAPVDFAGARGFELDDAAEFVGRALARSQVELVDELTVEPRDADSGAELLEFDLPVADHEGCVVLVEEDGVLRWELERSPDDRGGEPPPGLALAPDERPAAFALTLAPPAGERGLGLGRRLRVRVFRFIARHAVRLFERRRREGLVRLKSAFTNGWLPVEPSGLPRSRPVVLLIHGTFSSTLGCFGALALDDTRRFLERSLALGDLVLGYDHHTLGRTPLDNARALLDLFVAADLVDEPIRIVCHSRGGLVARCFARLLAELRGRPVEQVLCVATTDAGTRLAEPANWQRLADVVTNLAALAGAGWASGGGGAIADGIVGALLDGVVALIQDIAGGVLDPAAVPGLAAMTPGGAFLNELAPWGPDIAADRRAVVSDFGLADDHPGPLGRLDRLADAFFAGANDLVVENASTGHLLAADRLDVLAVDARVHHLNFFAAPSLVDWLKRHALDAMSFARPVKGLPESGAGERGPAALDTEDAGGRVDLYMHAHPPVSVRPRESFWIPLDLSRDAPTCAGPVGHGPVDPDRLVDVELVALENAVVTQAGRVSLRVPDPGALVRVSLSAEAQVAGRARLRAVVHQGGRITMSLELAIDVRADAPASEPSAVTKTASTHEAAPADHQLAILELRDAAGVRLRYNLTSPDNELAERHESARIDGDLGGYVVRLFDRLESEWQRAAGDPARFERKLRTLGAQLFEQLVPPDLRERLWERRGALRGLEILSDEQMIPWELVYVTPPGGASEGGYFLGELGLVRGLWGASTSAKIAVRSAVIVAPDYPPPLALPASPAERAALTRLLRAELLSPTSAEVIRLLQTPGSFDVLHIICHGDVSQDDAELLLGQASGMTPWQRDELSAAEVATFAKFREAGGERPLVFVNACKVGRGQRLLTSMGGWASALLTRGAGAFVAPLWSVGDQAARHFSEAFYRALLAGETFSDAATRARNAARSAGDPTWLAYAVYARPDGRLVPSWSA